MIHKLRLIFLLLLLAATLARAAGPAPATRPAIATVQQMVAQLCAPDDDRTVGSPGASRSATYFENALHDATGLPVWRQHFSLVLPILDDCHAVAHEITSDRDTAISITNIPLNPLLPCGGQLVALPGGTLTAPVTYAGAGTSAEIAALPIANQWVALEFSSDPTTWQRLAALGCKGLIFLGTPQTTAANFLAIDTPVPIGVPRFYCDDPYFTDYFRHHPPHELTITIHAHWEEREISNLLCLLPGQQTTPMSGTVPSDWTHQLVVLQARYDASSQVMGRAVGAQQSANAALLITLARQLAHTPNHLGVLIALTAGDEWNNRGTRMLDELLGSEQKKENLTVEALQKQSDLAHDAADAESHVTNSLAQLTHGDLATLQQQDLAALIQNAIDQQIVTVQAQLEIARLQGNDQGPAAQLDQQRHQLLATREAAGGSAIPTFAQRATILDAAQQLLTLHTADLQRRQREAAQRQEWLDLRSRLADLVPMIHLEFSLSSGSPQFGLFTRSHSTLVPLATSRMALFAREFTRYGDLAARRAVAEHRAPHFDPDSMQMRFTPDCFFSIRTTFASDALLLRGAAAATFATISDATGRIDTPNDTPDRIDWPTLDSQHQEITTMLLGHGADPGALTDPLFFGQAELSPQTADQPLTVLELSTGESLTTFGAPNVLVGGEAIAYKMPILPGAATRAQDWYLTHADGSIVIRSANTALNSRFRLQAFTFTPDGLPAQCLIANQNDVRGLVTEFIANRNQPQRCMLFPCQRFDALALYDPRFMDTLDRVDILDAARVQPAKYSAVWDTNGIAAAFMPQDLQWQLLASKGSLNNRMILLNASAQFPEGLGFHTTDRADVGPLNWRTASDLNALDADRKTNLQRVGISNAVIQDLHQQAQDYLTRADAGRRTLDYAAWSANSNAAWSIEKQVYDNLRSTANGTIKGVIFLLLAIVPFSFFLERLLIGASSIYRQLSWSGGIFLAMTALLWFHPAFRISAAPLMILLALLILVLSSIVMYILFGKFETELARLRGAATDSTINLTRGAVLGAAVGLGLSNMRRRGMRTTLTLITLVLLTFTLLFFTSVRESVQVTPRIMRDLPAFPPGILIRKTGWATLPPDTVAALTDTAGPNAILAQRWWYASENGDEPWLLPITDTAPSAASISVHGLLGIDPAEAQFQPVDLTRVLPQWNTFVHGAAVCWLPDTARAGGMSIGDPVIIMGHHLTIAGFYSEDALQSLREMTGDDFTPIDTASAAAPPAVAASPQELAATAESAYHFLPPSEVAIVPASVIRDLNAGRLTSIMLRPAPALSPQPSALSPMFSFAESLAQRSAYTIYASDGQTVQAINALQSSQPQDLDTVLVPMLIAGFIVLNTMLGAVAERTREIHVYTSVGMAPPHVGMLFLAEAAALGTLAVVFGYIAGQALATGLTALGLMSSANMNYSSFAAILTMGLVLAIVLASAIWPAISASRVAAPSLDPDWKLPPPDGDTLNVELPFTLNAKAAQGMCAFLAEYFQAASQAGIGQFTTEQISAFTEPAPFDPAQTIRGLRCRVWLAPYDAGVFHAFILRISPTPTSNVFDVRLQLIREGGSPGAWRRLSRPFLVNVRKQFLRWRTISPDTAAGYLHASQTMFTAPSPAGAPT